MAKELPNENKTMNTHSKKFSGPDMTIPCAMLGVVFGLGLTLVYPAHFKSILTFSLCVGWMIGFTITIVQNQDNIETPK